MLKIITHHHSPNLHRVDDVQSPGSEKGIEIGDLLQKRWILHVCEITEELLCERADVLLRARAHNGRNGHSGILQIN